MLFITGEDDFDDTIVPRLIEAGADLDRIVFLKTEVQDAFGLRDLETLDTALAQMGPTCRFVAIDPPTAFLHGVDDHKNAELRSLLTPLKSWSGANRVATIFNTHVNKPQGVKVEAMMRVMGSVAWVNTVRAAHMFARDPEDHDRRLFVPMKITNGKEGKGLAYRITDSNESARIEWLGEVDTTADEAINMERKQKKRRVIASAWLEELFAQKPEMSSREVDDRRKAETELSFDAVKEAKEDMGIRAHQKVDDDGRRAWWLYWPAEARARWEAGKGSRPPSSDG